MQGKYTRTDKIRQKQREKMLQVHKSFTDVQKQERVRKQKETQKVTGKKSGRKPGDGPPKTGIFKPCPVCNAPVYYTKKYMNLDKIKCCSRKCLGMYPPYRENLSNIDKSYMQTEEYKNTKRNPNLPAYKKYANLVRKVTEENYAKFADRINPAGYPRTLCGVVGGYQLDHIKSIKECWNEGISPEEAGDTSNLQMITWQQNLSKRKFNPIQ